MLGVSSESENISQLKSNMGTSDFVGGHLQRNAILSQNQDDLEHPMMVNFGYEASYQDHYAKH